MKVNAVFSGISVNDIENAKSFYTKILGLDLASDAMGLTFHLPFGGRLFIYEKPDHQAASYTALNLVVDDIDNAIDELVENGVSMERYDKLFPDANQDEKGVFRSENPVTDGPTIAWFKDPAGNTIALIQDE
jgi:predicted enzyme related to lactoylglutathione lyase